MSGGRALIYLRPQIVYLTHSFNKMLSSVTFMGAIGLLWYQQNRAIKRNYIALATFSYYVVNILAENWKRFDLLPPEREGRASHSQTGRPAGWRLRPTSEVAKLTNLNVTFVTFRCHDLPSLMILLFKHSLSFFLGKSSLSRILT